VEKYAETLVGGVTDASARADAVRQFLAHAKKAGFAATNLGAHLRLRKTAGPVRPRGQALAEVQMSADQHAALLSELEGLKAQRPRIIEDIKRARADKDFRENAPLDAARQHQGYIEGRIRELEARLDRAVIVQNEAPVSGDAVEIGCTVRLRNLGSGKETVYTLVRSGEVDAAQGRISFESPVGRALLQKRPGDEVEVTAPSGTLRFRIEAVEG
jgi:transcription elongation factor GreA